MPSALLTTEQVRDFVTTKLTDASIDTLIGAADESIISALGPHPPASDGNLIVEVRGGYRSLILPQRAKSIASITERDLGVQPSDAAALVSSSYWLEVDGQKISRSQRDSVRVGWDADALGPGGQRDLHSTGHHRGSKAGPDRDCPGQPQ